MNKKEKRWLFSLVLFMGLMQASTSYAMHIAEGFLPKTQALIWFIISAPFIVVGMRSLIKVTREQPERKLLLALSGAFVFLLSSLKLPAMTGSSAHTLQVLVSEQSYSDRSQCLSWEQSHLSSKRHFLHTEDSQHSEQMHFQWQFADRFVLGYFGKH